VRIRATVIALFLAVAVGAWAVGVLASLGPALAAACAGTLLWLSSLGVTLLCLVFLGGYLTRRLARSERQLAGTHRRLARSLRRLTEAHASLQDAYGCLACAEAEVIESDRLKTLQVLVAGLAHELGNPLTILAGNVEPLREAVAVCERTLAACAALADGATGAAATSARTALTDVAEARREAPLLLANCAEATRRAVGLLEQLRDFGRGGRGTVRRLAPLAPGLGGTLALLRYRVPPGVTVHESYAEVPDVVCVAAELNQVFINLLMNAIDAVTPGGNLWLSLDREGAEVRIRVRDDGSGIAGDVLPRIFEPFVTTKEAGRGTGLGLAISRSIVARHGGRIEVETAIGRGTTVTVRLPVGC
jgi:signal transduction histidine kinase